MEDLNQNREKLAKLLKERREELGLTQQQLAIATGYKQPTIARIEAGKFFINTKQLFVLCEALKLRIILKESKNFEIERG